MNFLVYNERPANLESTLPLLVDLFRDTDISVREFNSIDLKNGILTHRDTAGFCLPGIVGEVSGYTDQIGEFGLRQMSDAVSQGRFMLAICAGAYFVSRETVYRPNWGPEKTRSPASAIFNASAQGPVAQHGSEFGLSLPSVRYKSSGGDWRTTKIAYGNGPAFYSYATEGVEPLAYFGETEGEPLAAASVKHGEGKIVLLGVLPQIGWREVRPDKGFEQIRNFVDRMKAYEDDRKDFIATIEGHLKQQISTYREKVLSHDLA